jgi:hypothetical protein
MCPFPPPPTTTHHLLITPSPPPTTSQLEAGKRLRAYQPVFVYAMPVTAIGATLLTLCGLAFEAHTFFGADRHGVFGWLASAHYAPFVIYLGAMGGIVGHTGLNTLLK